MTIDDDVGVRDRVLAELRWAPPRVRCFTAIHPEQFDVDVQDGIVILSGEVDSWAKKFAAREAAYRAAGVRDVVVRIRVGSEGARGLVDQVRRAIPQREHGSMPTLPSPRPGDAMVSARRLARW